MPARIAGIILPNKPLKVALGYIYGVGPTLAKLIITKAELDPQIRPNDLSEAEVNRLRDIIEKQYKVEGDLRREVLLNIKRKREIGSYQGMRHFRNLPVRGQRTKTNSRTVRGNTRRTMGSGRKSSAEKT
ncbi:MAG: 30S ribosomal protein S13 [Candidatus Kerfeldbacteria bacterium CG08_land_8_20_14_0_20_43_14]|uniref:Small ribosomal subunit protein uS13 n=1 Tax=Candidatus Kerfeldbacteria bacterium CG08_land_8_20_14_0_20_43_14 TaxID=2014246 RepID=A0A2H0YPJ3_9BACT|nr:MAG: 30S ribosomal protein S13 [Candidatus Kerfeldbacteria bacterium CG08_land_8_20_14_0_20_43_14]